ncbi:hypothetical protein EfmAA290_25050 [Enterococcus faecium]|nr:hypothetical protein EfmAA290_25050 [Enterococcus faecium]
MKVIKNSILSRAAKKAGLEGMDEVFTGPTAVAFSNEDVVAPAKIMDEFAKEESRKMKKVRRPKNTKKPSKRMIHYLRKEKFQGSACPLRSSAAC